MNNSIVLSQNVLNTIKSLPREQQFSIVSAIAGEMIFGAKVKDELNDEEKRLYAIIKSDVCRDSMSYSSHMAV
ncbi:MAG: hypothetical protein K2J10_10620 [Muribaculaceae bacterium]|nr:hypothetical protein [Muribaculaceae bacterium]